MKYVKLFESFINSKDFDTTTPFLKPLRGYRTIKQNDGGYFVYHWEIGYGGISDWTLVAIYNKTNNSMRPAHGYYEPHPTGKFLSKKAKLFGIDWEQ